MCKRHSSCIFLKLEFTPQAAAVANQTGAMKCVKRAGRCDLLSFMGLEELKAGEWARPAAGVEGPTGNGLRNPGCTDCNGLGGTVQVCIVEQQYV